MKKVLVTGATGRIGANLIKALTGKGYDLIAFAMKTDPQLVKLNNYDCEIAYGDLLDEESIIHAIHGVDIVLHLGALMVQPERMRESTYWNINVLGTFMFVRAAANAGVKRFIYGSSDAIYSPLNYKYLPIDEDHPKNPINTYSLTKLVGEEILYEASYETGMPVTALRFGSVMAGDEILNNFSVQKAVSILTNFATKPGTHFYREDIKKPWEPLSEFLSEPKKMIIPRAPDFRPWRSHFTDVRDVVAGVIIAMESDRAVGESFNILGPYASSWEQSVKYIAEKTGSDYYECEVHNYFEFELSIEKARHMLGYSPQYDIYKMIDTALDIRNGKSSDLILPMLGNNFEAYDPYK
ncbi:MAG: NAD(P)-dependent oxidoreductase [Bacillota bacterium]|nr:NAD(P)-dependent oxidoreductase [Bacillota bacterium]